MTNNKRKWKAIGASLCAMALAISTGSMAVSAASPSGNDEIAAAQTVQSKECQVRQNETTGKMEMSLDNGKTWEALPEQSAAVVGEVAAKETDGTDGQWKLVTVEGKTGESAKEMGVQYATSVSSDQLGKVETIDAVESTEAIEVQIRQNDKTGKYEISTDGGKTWTEQNDEGEEAAAITSASTKASEAN